MKYVMLLALILVGCQAPDMEKEKGRKSGSDAIAADTLDAPVINDVLTLAGNWKKVGYYCGHTYAAVPERDYIQFGSHDYIFQNNSACGPRQNNKRFQYEQHDGYLTITHYSNFIGCNGNQTEQVASTYPLTRANYNYRIHGSTLELTSGVCGGGSFIDVYQKL